MSSESSGLTTALKWAPIAAESKTPKMTGEFGRLVLQEDHNQQDLQPYLAVGSRQCRGYDHGVKVTGKQEWRKQKAETPVV